MRCCRVAALSVEGVSKSSIARAMGISWNTVARWLERAAAAGVLIIKTWCSNRVRSVEQKVRIGSPRCLEAALARSEDSETLNTSFIERLNLTIRRGCAYLTRRAPSHARWTERLEEQLELVRCYYNFIRPHGALRFGRTTRTPAMQAGLVRGKLTFREIFLTCEGCRFTAPR